MKVNFAEREKWLFFLVVLVAIFYVFFQFIFFPKLESFFSLAQKLNLDKQQLTIYEEKSKALKQLELAPLEQLRAAKTKEKQTIEALQYISHSMSKLNIDLVSIRPRTQEVPVDFAKAIFFDIHFIGSYKNIYSFMEEISDLPILILVDSMIMKKSENADVEVSMVLSVYY
ncbi:hypothetical protein A2230_02235 [candidate division WOR-1 bacterium RIFOXYA2_FULL_36_21]|uniref:Pilus assembly protein PilO n=1 Tax=candidate division WOR-1 bacterium RIFOXYB2_FULL_36_35 TaxID=1802578 RepID=A0A1F4S5Z6_UNCSA|nr:MAG: hypothetical protein A2230_02235 [candidate division WOR-1 bacterium RIFOXYA2_FULL_36_21]OGC15830.1 MAG: hypothetical protein A2290_05790 [candidate division WOR-1 bacterium RIFOXYB2_FULL_36_35]OGC15908.1 MAG: hypothetical protein A2282_04920 [candidate division WOR-1 bacterium RIFOXYA12_FULL_36_13]